MTDAELMKQMAEELEVYEGLTRTKSDALAAYRQHQAAPAKDVCPECTVCGGRKCAACWDFIKDRPTCHGTGKREGEP